MDLPNNLADHPRYGKLPRFTGKDYRKDLLGRSWKYSGDEIIPNTAIPADTSKQHGSAIPIYVYYDVLKTCVDCGRPFIFFAEEQRHWFETLGFANDADCVRCVSCRKKQQADDRANTQYQTLLAKPDKSWEDYHDLASLTLDLYAKGKIKCLDKIRSFVNKIPDSQQHRIRIRKLHERIQEVVQADARNRGSADD